MIFQQKSKIFVIFGFPSEIFGLSHLIYLNNCDKKFEVKITKNDKDNGQEKQKNKENFEFMTFLKIQPQSKIYGICTLCPT